VLDDARLDDGATVDQPAAARIAGMTTSRRLSSSSTLRRNFDGSTDCRNFAQWLRIASVCQRGRVD